MELLNVLKTVGTGLLSGNPYGAAAITLINAFMPEDKQLPSAATGQQAQIAMQALPPEQRLMLESKKIDLQITESNNWAANVASMADADKSGNTMRPFIALLMAWAVVGVCAAIIAVILTEAFKSDSPLTVLKDSYELIAFSLGVPSLVLRSYFGMRTQEKVARYQAATGQQASGLGGISQLIASKITR